MNEVDISAKIKRTIKFGLPALLLASVAVASLVWYIMHGAGDLVVRDARVAGSMMEARVRVDGTLEQYLVQDGDEVKAGDVIAKIKVNVSEEQLQQLEQTVALSERNLEQLKQGTVVRTPRVVAAAPSSGVSAAEIERARSRMERMNQLFEMGAVSAVKRDEAAAEYYALEAQGVAVQSAPTVTYDTTVQATSPEVIKKAEIQLRQAQMALEMAKGNSGAADVVAPADGIVYLSGLAEGDEVKSGQSVAGIGTSESMWIEAYLTPEDAAAIRLGQVADFYVDRIKYEGVVIEIAEDRPDIKLESEDDKVEQQETVSAPDQPVEAEQNAAQPTQENTEGQPEAATVQETSEAESAPEAAEPVRMIVKISVAPEDMVNMKVGTASEVRFLKRG